MRLYDQDYVSHHCLQFTHNVSPVTPVHYRRNCVEVSGDLDISVVTFDSEMTFEKINSIAASQRFGILRKACRVFNDKSFLERCFLGFVLPVLECCSAMWCSAADTHFELPCLVVGFLSLGMLKFNITHCRIVDLLQYYVLGATRFTLFMVL